MSATLTDRCRRVVADVLGMRYEDVTLGTSHESVKDWDSMAMINLAMALEAELAIELGVEDASRLVSVSAILEIVQERGAK